MCLFIALMTTFVPVVLELLPVYLLQVHCSVYVI